MTEVRNTILLFFPIFDYGRKGCEYMPFSLLHLERAVRHTGLKIVIIDENDTPNYTSEIEKHRNSTLLAAVSVVTGFQIAGGIAFSKRIKEINPEINVLWGGWHPTITLEQTLKETYIDFIICGQGEKPFKLLVEALLNNMPIKDVHGLGFKNNGHCFINEAEDFGYLNDFSPVDYTKIDIKKYVLKTDFSERRLMYFATYGCPFSCSFCSGSQIFKKKWFAKNTDIIINDLKYFIKYAHIDSILFWDDNFFSNKKFVMELAQRFINENLNILWEGSAHAKGFLNMFGDDEVRLLYKSGLRRVSTGAESGSNSVLQKIKDNLTENDVLCMISLLKKHHITTFFSTMIGFPIKNTDDVKSTFKLIRKAKLIDSNVKVQINIYTPYPGTLLYQNAIEMGFKSPEKLEDWIYHSPATFKPPWIPKSFYKTLEAFMNFYLPFSEKNCYKRAPEKFRTKALIINAVFHPLIALRFRFNYFALPFEWYLFRALLKRYNKKNNDNYKFYAYGIFGI